MTSDVPDTRADLAQRVRDQLPAVLADLREHVAIESVSADEDRAPEVGRSARWVADKLTELGCPDVRVVAEDGGLPAVIGRFPAPPGAPTVCLYAHHDVQPTGERALWTADPFAVDGRGDRLYARGVADDKGGLAVHFAALRAFAGRPPVGITVFSEGEEEIGSPSLTALLERHRELLAADVFVIADSSNFDVGRPAFTTSLRGLVDCVVRVDTLDHALHSGQYGGVAPDALTTLCRLLATLHDERGNVAVAGLHAGPGPDLDYPAERLRAETGVLEGVEYLGEGPVVARMWTRPALSVIALDATAVAKASNTLAPSARAKISLRLAPGDDAARALQHLTRHLIENAPFGAHVSVEPGDTGQPSTIPFAGPVAEAAMTAFTEAFGVEPVLVGQGGSIPMIAEFQQAFPEAAVLVTAVVDPDSRMHGIDESLNLDDFAAACVAETLWVSALAATP